PREFLDPVRFISNRSSGRQGFAFAEAARDAGADVTLVAGPVHLSTPTGVERIDVVSAQEMKDAVTKRAPDADIFVSVAAVADYRPHTVHGQKLKKSQQSSTNFRVALKENEDIVGSIAGVEPRPFVVGFAAETESPLEYAREKRRRKCMDAIVVNDVSDAAIGFDSSDNAVTLIHAGGEVGLPKMRKGAIARRLVDEIATLYASGRGS
ncbi:MAG: bifunctional 4'-phosphopantothenoylcysteine decarboxylase/phosphopantothenoylcysteine synthetase, partial [Gammaproteobacteria bacterium]|nr:bifunctional 4'-phosphopantothenoylcysteine decarboxylase/phosphopantothenoylcysteine synthetase [Gammaproteobacteria bacterium]